MQIDWWTFALQTVNFLVLVWLLHRFLYRPAKEVIEKRKRLAEQAFADADREKGEAEAARRRFEADRDRLAQERRDMLKNLQKELNTERLKVMDEAKHEAAALLAATRDSLTKERESALTDVRDQVAGMAVDLASRLLRHGGADALLFEQFAKLLKQMPAEERQRLQGDLAENKVRLTVVTASALMPEEKQRWIEWISETFGRRDKTGFVTDPEILGGAEIRFPHATLSLTWADQLRRAREVLRDNDAAA